MGPGPSGTGAPGAGCCFAPGRSLLLPPAPATCSGISGISLGRVPSCLGPVLSHWAPQRGRTPSHRCRSRLSCRKTPSLWHGCHAWRRHDRSGTEPTCCPAMSASAAALCSPCHHGHPHPSTGPEGSAARGPRNPSHCKQALREHLAPTAAPMPTRCGTHTARHRPQGEPWRGFPAVPVRGSPRVTSTLEWGARAGERARRGGSSSAALGDALPCLWGKGISGL